jgi:hypothetical protein
MNTRNKRALAALAVPLVIGLIALLVGDWSGWLPLQVAGLVLTFLVPVPVSLVVWLFLDPVLEEGWWALRDAIRHLPRLVAGYVRRALPALALVTLLHVFAGCSAWLSAKMEGQVYDLDSFLWPELYIDLVFYIALRMAGFPWSWRSAHASDSPDAAR